MSVVLVSVFSPSGIAADSTIRTSFAGTSTIFVAEIEHLEPKSGCEPATRYGSRSPSCTTAVRARAVRIFKDGDKQGLVPGDFETEIVQHSRTLGTANYWTGKEIKAGRLYLVFSNAKGGLSGALASPSAADPITDEEDLLSDFELTVKTEPLTIREKASAVVAAIAGATKPRSGGLSGYAALILDAGSDTDTIELAQTIETSSDLVFSPMAKFALITTLAEQIRTNKNAPDNLIHVFVTMTARYLPTEPKPEEPWTEIRPRILRDYLPWILGSERAKSVIRTGLPSRLGEQFRKKALELAADSRLPSQQRAQLSQIAALSRQPTGH